MALSNYERLTRAIERISRDGHAKHALVDSNGGVCLLGALLGSAHYADLGDGDLAAVGECVDLMQLPLSGVTWNNEPERTKEEVLARLESARDRILHQEADKGAVPVDATELVGVV